jgi:hypothetical protein
MKTQMGAILKYPVLFAVGGTLLGALTLFRPEELSWYNHFLLWPMSLASRISKQAGLSDYLNQNRYLYSLAMFLGWGLIGLLYAIHDIERHRGVPLPRRKNTIISSGVILVCAFLVYGYLKTPALHAVRTASPDNVRSNYSDSDRAKAKSTLEQYGRTGLIKKFETVGDINYVIVDGQLWNRLPSEAKNAFLREVIRSYMVLGYSTRITVMESESNRILGRADLNGVHVN